jgi:hypothetical protein
MGEVLSFRPKRPLSESTVVADARAAAATMPAWSVELWAGYYDLANWQVSRKGNPFVWVAGRPVTVFQRGGGWRWSIGRSAREGPLFSGQTYPTEREARDGAWEALKAMVLAEHREPA